MSIFGKILDKLGLRKAPHASTTTSAQAGSPQSKPATAPTQTATQTAAPGAQRTAPPPMPSGARPAQATPKPQPMSDTDVVARLERLAADNPQALNWRSSIVDLMKLLGMESSLAERKELAAELGYPREQMDDTARMNVWLHKQVLRRIAENGGNVPKELLD